MVRGYNGLGLTASGKRKIAEGKAFDAFFPKAISEDPILNKNGNVYNTVEYCGQIVAKTLDQTKELSKIFKRNSLNETCEAVFNFFYKHYQYKMDKNGVEQLRSPSRAWKDRKSGIDCDCFAISAGSILANLGIPFYFRIVKMYGRDYYQHIYLVIPKDEKADLNNKSNYYVIDPVLDKYNVEAPGITDKKDTKMEGLPIQYLNGVGDSHRFGSEFIGIGEKLSPLEAIKHFQRKGHKMHTHHYHNGKSIHHPHSFHADYLNRTKMHLINTSEHIAKNPHKYRHLYNPMVLKGHFDHAIKHWDNEQTREAALHHLSNVEEHAFQPHLQGIGELLNGTADELYAGISGYDLEGLGRSKSTKKKNGFFTKLKNLDSKIKGGLKKGLKKLGAAAKKGFHVLVRYNPATLAIRASFLLAMKINFLRFSSRMYWGYFPLATAMKHGISKDYWQRAVKAIAKVSKMFYAIGGSDAALRKSITTGHARKVVDKLAKQGKIGGLGAAPAAAGALVAAGTVLTAVAAIFKSIFAGKKKGTEVQENGREASAPDDTAAGSGVIDQAQNALTAVQNAIAPDANASAETTAAARTASTDDASTSDDNTTPDDDGSTNGGNTRKAFPGKKGTATIKDTAADTADASATPGADTTATPNADGSTTNPDGSVTNADGTVTPAKKSNAPLIAGGLAAAGILAYVLLKGKKKGADKKATAGVGTTKKHSRKKAAKRKKTHVKIK